MLWNLCLGVIHDCIGRPYAMLGMKPELAICNANALLSILSLQAWLTFLKDLSRSWFQNKNKMGLVLGISHRT